MPPVPPTVLLADRDAAALSYAAERLRGEGFAISEAESADAALALARTQAFKIVVIANDVAGVDCAGLIGAMRAEPSLAHVPIVVLVQRDEIDAIDRVYAAGATAFVARPIHWKAMAHQLRFVLRADEQAQALRAARDEAERAMAFKSNMLRLLQHELRTPLASIVGFSEELSRAPASRYSAEFAGHVAQAGRQLNRQFTALFSAAEVISGDVLWDFEPVTLKDLVSVVETSEAAFAARENAQVRYAVECPSAIIQADGRYLPIALAHLVRNGVAHGVAASGERRVDVAAVANAGKASGRVVIVVRDYGPGIAPETLAQCFEPFRQGEDALTRSAQGFGLGLAFARRVVEAHGGRLAVQQAPEGGCLVTVLLPAIVPANLQADREVSAASAVKSA